MESRLEDEFAKLRSFLETHFERQGSLVRELSQQLHNGKSHRYQPHVSSIPEEGSGSSEVVLTERKSTFSDLSSIDRHLGGHRQAESEMEAPVQSLDTTALQVSERDEQALREARRSQLRPQGTAQSMDSTDTFVSGFLERSEQNAYRAADRLTEQRTLTAQLARATEQRDCRAQVRRLTASSLFIYGVTTTIVFNLVILGIEVDTSAQLGQNDIPEWFGICNGAVVMLFTMELFLNLFAQGFSGFFCGRERWWNIFDLSIILVSLLETVLDIWVALDSQNQGVSPRHLRFARSVRLARALRGIRVMRLLRYVSALRTLVLSIMSSMASLLWTLLLLMLLFYSFGVLFTQLVTDECRIQSILNTEDPNTVPNCEGISGAHFWNSIPESMLTLFMAITGGVDWEQTLEPLRKISILAAGCMVVYVIITFFAIVNVITGVFVTTAMETTSADKDLQVMKQLQKHNAQVEDLKEMFQEITGLRDAGEVSIEQFKAAMSIPKFAAFLQAMGISTDLEDVGVLFKLLDADASGLVELDEFIKGCLSIQGNAKGLQLARMSYENKLTRREIKHVHKGVTRLLKLHCDHEENFEV